MGVPVGGISIVFCLMVLHGLVQIMLNETVEQEFEEAHLSHVDVLVARHERGIVSEPEVERNPGVRVEMPDWGLVKMDVELKNEWERVDLPSQTQWERLLAED